MTDMLVKLYDLPDAAVTPASPSGIDLIVRRAMASEKNRIVGWVRSRFGEGWAAECEIAFSRQPIACTIAVVGDQVAGFACHDCTALNFFGPIGIESGFHRKGVGRAVLLATLNAMAHAGYAYAIIGAAGPTDFFEKCAGAIPIPGSTPGIYRPRLNLS
ncbi:MAG: GNAT family N-acetyltransferase [Desulfosarcina sp.]